jgi:hypothetical protein
LFPNPSKWEVKAQKWAKAPKRGRRRKEEEEEEEEEEEKITLIRWCRPIIRTYSVQ